MTIKRILAAFLALCLTVSISGNVLAAELGEDSASEAGEEAAPAAVSEELAAEENSVAVPEAGEEAASTVITEELAAEEAGSAALPAGGGAEPAAETGEESAVSQAGTPGAPYTTWNSPTVAQIGEKVEFMLDSYNGSYTANQVWLAVNVPHDHQAIRMDFSGVAKGMYAYVYSASALRNSAPTGSNYLARFGSFSGSASYSCQVDYTGAYYILLIPSSSSNTFNTVNATVAFSLVDGDGNEDASPGGNNVWSSATELTENVNSYFNLNGSNDVDWFKITTSFPGQAIKIVLSNFDYTVKQVCAVLYSEEQAQSGRGSLLTKNFLSKDNSFSYKANERGTYYLCLKPQNSTEFFERSLKVRYELVDPDDYEVNDTWQTAAPVPQDGYEMAFTLNGENDEDWFWFETSEANEVVDFTVSGFETDYSNKLDFYVYDIDPATGKQTKLDWCYMDRNSHGKRTVQFKTPGRHYVWIDLSGYIPIENSLFFKLESHWIGTDHSEPNETWQTATPLYDLVATVFSLPAASDVDWFSFTVDDPNQTVEFIFEIPAGGSINARLYSRDELEISDNNARYMKDFFPATGGSGAGKKTVRWMLEGEGEYCLKVWPGGSNIFDDAGYIYYDLIQPDEHERNDSWKTAAPLNEGVAASFTLPVSNDVDWFRFDTFSPDLTVEFTLTVPAGGSMSAKLYSESDFKAEGDNAPTMKYFYSGTGGSGAGVKTMRWMLGDAGAYYLKVEPYSGSIVDEEYTLTCELIEPDDNERNNTWRTATPLNEGVASVFTFPASNDIDYFKVTTAERDQTAGIRLTIPEGGSVYMDLYAGEDYALQGDNAPYKEFFFPSTTKGSGSGVFTCYYTLEEPGEYYLKVYPDSSGIFDADATITYTLTGPDAQENNNSWKNATELHAQTNVAFTLLALNDEDWFKIDNVTPGDIITIYLSNLPKGSCSISNTVHHITSADVSPTQDDGKSCALSSKEVTSYKRAFTVNKEGEYYIRLKIGTGKLVSLDTPMTFRYSISRENIDVKSVGVSSIGNASTTIYQGKTLGLYAVINPANASNQNVTWTSSNPAVATVDANGLVTGVSPGTATITVTTEATDPINKRPFTASSTITVAAPVPVEGVIVTSDEVGSPGVWTNPKILSQYTAIQLSYKTIPEGATNQNVTWTVSDPAVLSVTDYGKVAAIGSGAAWVTVTTEDGGHTAEYHISVPDESSPIKRISLDLNAATIYMGEEGLQLAANIFPSNATNQQVRWSSSNPAAAAVDENGFVTPVSVGYAKITVAAQENGAIQASCSVSVQPQRVRVSGISFSGGTFELGLYGVGTLVPTIAPANATDKSVTWESSNKNIVSVSRGGVVTGLNIGTATITATTVDGQKNASITVRVSSNAPLGDLNNDGDVDSADALLILRSSIGLMALSEAQKSVADVNSDGSIDAGDAILILRYDAGLIQECSPARKSEVW